MAGRAPRLDHRGVEVTNREIAEKIVERIPDDLTANINWLIIAREIEAALDAKDAEIERLFAINKDATERISFRRGCCEMESQ